MTRLFMYGTRLQEFEQMIMLVANLLSEGKGYCIKNVLHSANKVSPVGFAIL